MARSAIRILIGFWIIILIGFWPTYLSRLTEVAWQGHFHGLLVFGWYALLLVQATLIQTGRRPLHRALGWLSLAWAPLLVVAAITAARYLLGKDENPPTLYNLSLFSMIVPIALSFIVLYVQAIRHRRTMALHARYMITTGIVFLLPAWSRLLGIYVLPALGLVDNPPTLSQLLLADQVGLVIMQAFTLVLLLNDRHRAQPWQPYGLCLLLLLATNACLYLLPGLEAWAALGRAIMLTP